MVQHQNCTFEQWDELIYSHTSTFFGHGTLLLCPNLCLCSAVHGCVSVHCCTCQPHRLLCGWVNVVTQTGMPLCYMSAGSMSCCHVSVLLLCHHTLACPSCDFAYWLAGLTLPLLLARSPTHPPAPTHPLTHITEVVHHVQGQFLEIEAAMVALAACWVHPLPTLNRHRPQQRISDGYGLALLASMACCLQLAQMLMMALLCTRPWFQGGLGISSWVSICTPWCSTYLAKRCDA